VDSTAGKPRLLDFECDLHGVFDVEISADDWERGLVFKRPCPRCKVNCPRHRVPVVPGAPAIWGDIRPSRAYYSHDKGRMITRKRDLRDFYKETGTYPMSDRDIADAVDNVQVAHREAEADLKWYDSLPASEEGLCGDAALGWGPCAAAA